MLILKALAENLGERQPQDLVGMLLSSLVAPTSLSMARASWGGRSAPPLLVQLRKAPVTITGYEQLSIPKNIRSFKVFPLGNSGPKMS